RAGATCRGSRTRTASPRTRWGRPTSTRRRCWTGSPPGRPTTWATARSRASPWTADLVAPCSPRPADGAAAGPRVRPGQDEGRCGTPDHARGGPCPYPIVVTYRVSANIAVGGYRSADRAGRPTATRTTPRDDAGRTERPTMVERQDEE